MSETRPVRIAMLGSGIFAKDAHLPALAQLNGRISLVANWSRSESSAIDFQQFAQAEHSIHTESYSGEEGLDSLLRRKDIDGVILALPISSQPDFIVKCLAAGKHVLSEKPIADTVTRARQLIAEYENKYQTRNLIWEVAEQFYHEPRYQRVREVLESQRLGPVHFFQQTVFIHMEKGSKYHSTSWRTIPDYQGGFLLDGGVHFAAGLAAMLGPIRCINGSSTLHRDHLAPKDTCYAAVRTQNGVDGTMIMSMGAAPTLGKTETIISCQKGHIELAAAPDSEGGWLLSIFTADQEKMEERFPSTGVRREILSFGQSIQSLLKGQSKATSRTAGKALQDLAFIEACVNDSNSWVELDKMQ